jgi:hypothetical protein
VLICFNAAFNLGVNAGARGSAVSFWHCDTGVVIAEDDFDAHTKRTLPMISPYNQIHQPI